MIGNIVQGSVQDCNKKYFLRRLKHFDPNLYIQWNPSRKDGYGCWELWRKADYKTAVHQTGNYYTLEQKDTYLLNYIGDLHALSESIFTQLAKADTWKDKHYIDNKEYNEERNIIKAENNERAELKYQLMHNKSVLNRIRELILEGKNPLSAFTEAKRKS